MTRLLASLAVCLSCVIAYAEEPKPLPIGASAPDFSLPGVDGKQHSLKDFASAKVLALVFTCNHCPTAQAYEPRVQKLHDDYKDKGVAVVAISTNDPLALRLDELGFTDVGDSFDDMKQRAKDINITYPYLYDGDDQVVGRAYGPASTPHVFVFDSERKLRYAGRIDDSERASDVKSHDMRNAIDALLAGNEVTVPLTNSIGCSTKWSEKRGSVQESLEKWAKEPVTLNNISAEGIADLLKNDTNKFRLINVWTTWCGPCVVEFPEFVTMHRMYITRDFEMVTISGDTAENAKRVEEFLKKQQASMTNYRFDNDDTYKLVEAIGNGWTGAFPFTLLVAPGGKVVYKHQGAIDPLTVKKAIVEQLGRTYK